MSGNQGRRVSLMEAVKMASLSEENGCKVHSDGKRTIVVRDCYKWGKHNMNILLFLRPTAEVSIHASVNSLSGFKIIIHEPIEQTQFMWRALIALISTVVFTLCFCFSYDYLLTDLWSYIVKGKELFRQQLGHYSGMANDNKKPEEL